MILLERTELFTLNLLERTELLAPFLLEMKELLTLFLLLKQSSRPCSCWRGALYLNPA
jgi:hypothetical protein